MSWANKHIERLQAGETVKFRPHGNSMRPLILSGNLVTAVPLKDDDALKVNDIVLCRVKGKQYLHLIKAVDGDRFQIGNNHGGINGWIKRSAIYGLATQVES